jgi:hypothetical protein
MAIKTLPFIPVELLLMLCIVIVVTVLVYLASPIPVRGALADNHRDDEDERSRRDESAGYPLVQYLQQVVRRNCGVVGHVPQSHGVTGRAPANQRPSVGRCVRGAPPWEGS